MVFNLRLITPKKMCLNRREVFQAAFSNIRADQSVNKLRAPMSNNHGYIG